MNFDNIGNTSVKGEDLTLHMKITLLL